MIVSIDWLKDYIDIDIPLEELAEKLTVAGLECVLKEAGKSVPAGVVVGRVLDKKAHPDADSLSVCTVDIGSGDPLNIVCGAPNVAAGQIVPLATIGTYLRPDFQIKKATLRGIESQGMICAEDELGLGSDHAGIMVLSDDHQVGAPFSDYFPSHKVLDIDITANRPDAMSHWGVAREIAAITGKTFRRAPVRLEEKGPDIHSLARVTVAAPEGCPRYTARVIEGVHIAPSPAWLRERLEACGLRSINNVVDASNYVLMETGHPLHTFDFDKLEGKMINVRFAVAGEKFETLDHKERELSADMLLICDEKKPLALAGIMGGTLSEVDEHTVSVLIESAYFDPATIRKGSKQEQISTDASKRFERGTDPNGTLAYAQDRLASLILELAGGTLAKGLIDFYPNPVDAREVTLHADYVKGVTGIGITIPECRPILTALGFEP
ncbi:MAG: phenylalanine--tRNA ligase subunit beta, partial [Candidatus Marinimicrobia bacterium]|nr:phenylalanine--tRNA ligase subunit beta [Candidatus Neomarinimicrobiota bacterium]